MGRGKKYDGYKAFQYLKAGFDYKEYKLCSEFNRVPPYFVPLSKTEEEHFENIIEKNLVIDLHEHPVLWPDDMSLAMEFNSMGRGFLAYEALSVSGIDCIFDNLMNGTTYITSYNGWKWSDIIHDIGIRLSDIHHQKMVFPCHNVDDIIEAHKAGKIALVLCLESSTPIENELDRIDVLYGLGVRSMGICYSESNMLGGGMSETDKTTGLSDFGYDAVKRMNKLGMLIDVGHTNDKTALDTIEASDKPIYNSHSGPSSFAKGHVMSDEAIIAMAEKDGLIGIGGAGRGLTTKKNPLGCIESYMEIIEYCINLVGIDHVGCGPDTLYGNHQGLYKYWFSRRLGHYNRSSRLSQQGRETQLSEKNDPGYVKGLENPNEFINIARWMIKNGYSDNDVSKIIGLNALNLLKKVW
ncbi:membrane dipeptidase [Candidatus Bathyarchaeota archaeon]|nr:membrane dipeptidase [Candidatus Bathyarchaeota archaeon]